MTHTVSPAACASLSRGSRTKPLARVVVLSSAAAR
jgi:hypothetical protein